MLSQTITSTTTNSQSSFILHQNLSPSSSLDSPSNHPGSCYPKKTGKWTIEEDNLLRQFVGKYGEKQWRKISCHIAGRTSIQCLHRWSKILRPGLVKGPWTQEEDDKLVNWVKAEGPNKWALAANLIPGRSGKQCRERWFNNLDPEIKKGEWSKEEDELIFKLYQKYGSSWSKIAKFVSGRTENSIKNRFYSTLRKLTADKKKNNLGKEVCSDTSVHVDCDAEEETLSKTTCEVSNGEAPHTLYKLLKDSAIIEAKEDQGEDEEEEEKFGKEKQSILRSEGLSNFSRCNSEFDFVFDNNERFVLGLNQNHILEHNSFLSPSKRTVSKNHSAQKSQDGNNKASRIDSDDSEALGLHIQNLLKKMDKTPSKQFPPRNSRNVHHHQQHQQFNNNLAYLQSQSLKQQQQQSQNRLFLSPQQASTQCGLRDFSIPSLGSRQLSSESNNNNNPRRHELKDLSNPVEIRLDDEDKVLVRRGIIPQFSPVQNSENLLLSRNLSQPLGFAQDSLSTQYSQRNVPLLLNSQSPPLQYNPRFRNEANNLGMPVRTERLNAGNYTNQSPLLNYLQKIKQNEVNFQQVKESGFPMQQFDLFGTQRNNVQQQQQQMNSFPNHMEMLLPNRPSPDQQDHSQFNLLFSQIRSLENLFSNVNSKLINLETSLNENHKGKYDFPMTERHELTPLGKRSFNEMMFNKNVPIDALYKKVKIE